ncbi:MAG: hypothetical protein KTR31_00230 [Myxococcales bacterium]|nr:hypothetical protein [Myxococcales bacterium]
MTEQRQLDPTMAKVLPVVVVGVAMLTCIGVCVGFPCMTTGIRYGMWVDRCPATDLRLDVSAEAYGLLRGQQAGTVIVRPRARWLSSDDKHAIQLEEPMPRGFSVQGTLLDAAGDEIDGLHLDRFKLFDQGRFSEVTLPDVPDGDYVLRLDVDAGFEAQQVDLELPLYAPALVHTMTDRPLYKPGQEVLLRSVVLRRTDQTPIEGRPGRWRIEDPNGQPMLVEKDEAGPWGIADTSFPLDARAAIGTWSATWETGQASDRVTFDVRPFQLPRSTVDASPSKSWFAIGDDVVVEGRATFTSGAPVRNAPVRLTLQPATGRWPMPLSWEEERTARTGSDGRFTVTVGTVPPDLMDRTTLRATVRVTDDTQDTTATATTLVLSKESLLAEAVTELGDGLVGGFNNRAYLRVATPDGTPARKAEVLVRNPYDPLDKGRRATADVDGVVALQIDPGDPVTVVEPAAPVRPRPVTPDEPRLQSATVVGGGSLQLDTRRSLDALHPAIARCGTYALGNTTVDVAVRVGSAGRVTSAMAAGGPLRSCVQRVMQSARIAGGPTTLKLQWVVPDSQQPRLALSTHGAWGSAPVGEALNDAALSARTCLARGRGVTGSHLMDVRWTVAEGSVAPSMEIGQHAGSGLAPASISCVRNALRAARLAEPASQAAMGVTTVQLQVPGPAGAVSQGPTTRTAYQLKVEATQDGEALGEGTVILPSGHIPALRLRATPSLAAPGDEVVVELFRGPQFGGVLPEELHLYEGSREVAEAPVEDRTARFTIPTGVDGFLTVSWGSARTVIYVAPPEPLTVRLATDQPAYRPGTEASLTVTTQGGESPRPAAVGLVGVDSALGQLAPLLGPDDYGRITVRATSDSPAFDTFDPRALVLGQVRGDNAAKAAVLRISTVPQDPAGDEPTTAHGQVRVNTDEVLIDSFYRVLAKTVDNVRRWEREAPAEEQMRPATMAGLYGEALASLRGNGQPAVDGFGRELTLDLLPADLLEQVDPRQVVADGTRLPEDVESFPRYVEEEVAQ